MTQAYIYLPCRISFSTRYQSPRNELSHASHVMGFTSSGFGGAGAQAILTALRSFPKDADVQRWGCEALIPLFGDPLIETSYREAGLEAVLRAFEMLQGVETSLKNMGIAPACGSWKHKNGYDSPREEANKCSRASPARKRWDRAIKKAILLCSVLLFSRAVYSQCFVGAGGGRANMPTG